MLPYLHRWKISLSDKLRFSKILRWALFYKKALFRSSDALSKLEQLCAAARLAINEDQIKATESRINALEFDLDRIRPLLVGDDFEQIRKAAILKPYNAETGEPGVVFISFEYEWAKLLGARNLEAFSKQYLLVVSPTWTPPHSAVNCLFPQIFPAPVYCLISNDTDLETFPRLSDNYRMIDLFASSWVDPGLFHPVPTSEKDIDLVMLANFGAYKRHHALFRVIADLPKEWRIVLVGQPNGGRTSDVLLAEAAAFGVRDRIELRERVSDEEVCELLCRARISLICSRREGSCVAVVESMFADTPTGLLNGAQIGSARFINSSTGAFLDESNLGQELVDFHQKAESMSPRSWCLENGLSAEGSSAKLNDFLASDSKSRNLPWTSDIEPMHWRPNPILSRETDPEWLQGETQRVFDLTGIRLGSQPVS